MVASKYATLICSMVVATSKCHRGSPGSISQRKIEPGLIFPFIATKLASKNKGPGASRGFMQLVSAESCRMWGIEADFSQLKHGAGGEHLTSQLSWKAA